MFCFVPINHMSRRKEILFITTVINGIHELFDLSIVVNEVICLHDEDSYEHSRIVEHILA